MVAPRAETGPALAPRPRPPHPSALQDESPGIATEYGIRSIPTVMVFKDGEKRDVVIGAVPKSTLVQTLEKYVD